MAQFRKKTVVVEAVQLLWSTWTEMCALVGVGDLADGKPSGCYVNASDRVTNDTNGRIGLRIPAHGGGVVLLAVEGDWVVRGADGELRAYKPEEFAVEFEDVLQRHQDYSVDFEPDWTKYPKLADTFRHRPRENVYWGELRALLGEARADAVQYIRDVRVEELARARSVEQSRIWKEVGPIAQKLEKIQKWVDTFKAGQSTETEVVHQVRGILDGKV